jgi:hypothetical protein
VSDQVTNKPSSPPPEPTCPECGADVPDRLATHCPVCKEPINMAGIGGAPNPFRLRGPQGDNPAWAWFGAQMMLLFAVLAVESPGILIGLLILAVPALIRMVVLSERSLADGRGLTSGSMVLAFLTSIGIVIVVSLATAIAFSVTCFTFGLTLLALDGGQGAGILFPAVAIGGIAGLIVFIKMIHALSRRKG